MENFEICETGSIVRTNTVLYVIIRTFVSKDISSMYSCMHNAVMLW